MTPYRLVRAMVVLAVTLTAGLQFVRWINTSEVAEGDPYDTPIGINTPATSTTLVPLDTITTVPTTSTSSTAATTTTLDEGWLCPDAVHIARMVGWPEAELVTLDAIMFRESRCDGRQHNTDDPASGSRGLLQINGYWCATTDFLQQAGVLWDCDDLFDDVTSLKAGLVIWTRSGWQPWGGGA